MRAIVKYCMQMSKNWSNNNSFRDKKVEMTEIAELSSFINISNYKVVPRFLAELHGKIELKPKLVILSRKFF